MTRDIARVSTLGFVQLGSPTRRFGLHHIRQEGTTVMKLPNGVSRTSIALVLAGAGIALPAAASPANATAGGNEALQYCRSIAHRYDGNIIGPCTSFFRSHDFNARATTVFFCRTVFVPRGRFATVGKCVSTIGSNY